jgi:hypothetical protein
MRRGNGTKRKARKRESGNLWQAVVDPNGDLEDEVGEPAYAEATARQFTGKTIGAHELKAGNRGKDLNAKARRREDAKGEGETAQSGKRESGKAETGKTP